jgi:hypothetical protein
MVCAPFPAGAELRLLAVCAEPPRERQFSSSSRIGPVERDVMEGHAPQTRQQ